MKVTHWLVKSKTLSVFNLQGIPIFVLALFLQLPGDPVFGRV
jgi:hypothetical protein